MSGIAVNRLAAVSDVGEGAAVTCRWNWRLLAVTATRARTTTAAVARSVPKAAKPKVDRLILPGTLLRRWAIRLEPIPVAGKDNSAWRVDSIVPDANTMAQLGASSWPTVSV